MAVAASTQVGAAAKLASPHGQGAKGRARGQWRGRGSAGLRPWATTPQAGAPGCPHFPSPLDGLATPETLADPPTLPTGRRQAWDDDGVARRRNLTRGSDSGVRLMFCAELECGEIHAEGLGQPTRVARMGGAASLLPARDGP
jgi:hypothetical protein